MVSAAFWSENGYTFCPFCSGIGYDFRVQGTTKVYERLLFHFQMTNERIKSNKSKSKWILRNLLFGFNSKRSNDDIIIQRPGLKTGTDFRALTNRKTDLAEIASGSGFGKSGATSKNS